MKRSGRKFLNPVSGNANIQWSVQTHRGRSRDTNKPRKIKTIAADFALSDCSSTTVLEFYVGGGQPARAHKQELGQRLKKARRLLRETVMFVKALEEAAKEVEDE